MNKFMRRAVDLAAQNVKDGGQPFGAVLVKNDIPVSEGVNELHMKYDVSGHAELIAIRRAQEDFETNDLSEFTMYASGEPCPMCLTAMQFAGIKDVYYCQSVKDAEGAGLSKSKEIYEDLQKPKEERTLQMIQIPLQEKQINPMELYKEKS
ncbi:nucleoside deaminase [Virgibacillus halodenitrificans]|uniref:Nucleoside deaminase n=1 Tax=Virgibacillus halodenitrificans TaxID=1482 RepID=A0ABR7VMC5_VIRHA|nr:nucleoside deaminase [Virgibacillus halodenitrificans]MBD1223045.1 nucleoside deaminase [Virgibacillus halodenitrificans]MCG1027401.1 nucleoside deaminase [Virgibacillus halodenitrificans]MCJ0930303.1 nucleoside deaminase [Virgibacillus halodenitrificans]